MQTIEDKEEEPQGRAKEGAMNNAGIEPVNDVRVAKPRGATVQANNNKTDSNNNHKEENEEDDDSSITEVDISPKPKVDPIVISVGIDSDEGKDEDDFFGADDDNKVGTPDGTVNQGVWRSERAGRGTTSKYKDDYKRLMDMRKAACGGPWRAIIKDGVTCFSAQDLDDAEPMVEED